MKESFSSFENPPPATPETAPELEEKEKLKPSEVITEKGSMYRYLPDGRTQRLKTATGELREVQDTLTFIPPYDVIKGQGPKLYPDIFKGIENAAQYEQHLLEYSQLKGRTIRVVGKDGKELTTPADIETAERIFLAFVDKNDPKKSFTIPVAKEPKVGYLTFDTRKYKGEDGKTYRERHIGNRVKEIKYSSEKMEPKIFQDTNK